MPVSACPVSWVDKDLSTAKEYLSGKRDGELLSPYSDFLNLLTAANAVFPPPNGTRNLISLEQGDTPNGTLILNVECNNQGFKITLDTWDWKDSIGELRTARASIVEQQRADLK